MNLNQKFNSLHGTIVSRKTLEILLAKAEKEKYTHISSRIIRILEKYPDDRFLIEIANLVEPYGLNGSEMEMFDIDDLNEPEIESGLNGIPQADIYDLITKKIIADFENDHKWESGINDVFDDDVFLTAFNFKTRKPYRGINQLLLGDMFGTGKLKNPFYLTFNQVKELKGTIKKGAKSREAIFYTILYKYKDFKTTDRQKFIEYLKNKGSFKPEEIPTILAQHGYGIIRIYNVFNGKDIEGIDFKLDQLKAKESNDKIEIADKIIEKYPAPAPTIKYGGKQPFYERIRDYVQMPKKTSFEDIRIFYAVMFHELVHSTGAPNRLNREKGLKFGDNKYAFEELVAEIGSCFLSATCGFLYYVNKNANAYIKGWRQGIIAELKKDNKGIFKAAALAQKAVDFMLTNITEKDFEATKNIEIIKEKTTLKPKFKNGDTVKTKIFYADTPKGTVGTISQKKERINKSGVFYRVIVGKNKSGQILSNIYPENVLELFEEKPTNVINQPKKSKTKKETSKGLNSPVTKTKKDNLKNSSITALERIGFISASKVPETPSDVFQLNGEIGKFLQKIQPHKALILIKGTKHTSKSQLAMQIANGFAEIGKPVAYIDYEQGGMESKDTIDSINRNTSQKGRELIAVKGFLENPMKELQEFCKYCEVIVADSVTDLGITADQLNELRVGYPKVIWVFISQVKENGEMYGGNKMAHNPTAIVKCHPSEDPKERYATLEKNRGNDLSLKYSMFHKKLINEQNELDTAQTKSKLSFHVN